MRHVDEGWLHAYIDGAFEAGTAERADIEAHLAACADCRVRLDDARRIRDVSQAALDAVAPAASPTPAWDTIVAEHARRRDGGGALPAPVKRPRIPLAWAASLVLAVGAGWMARAMLAERPPAMESQVGSALAPETESAEPSQAMDLARSAEAAPPAAEPARRDATAPPAPQRADADARSARQRAGETADRSRAELPVSPQAKAAVAAPLANSVAGRAAAADEAGIARPAAMGIAAAADSAADRWRTVDMVDVVASFDTEPLRIEGLNPDTLQLTTVGGVPMVRSVFVRPDGAVEVLQRPSAAALLDDVQEAREAEAGARSARTVLRGIEVLVRGSSAAAVQEIRARLR